MASIFSRFDDKKMGLWVAKKTSDQICENYLWIGMESPDLCRNHGE